MTGLTKTIVELAQARRQYVIEIDHLAFTTVDGHLRVTVSRDEFLRLAKAFAEKLEGH